jgi:hypothetical protein
MAPQRSPVDASLEYQIFLSRRLTNGAVWLY